MFITEIVAFGFCVACPGTIAGIILALSLPTD